MNIDLIIEELAKAHSLTSNDYLERRLTSVYPQYWDISSDFYDETKNGKLINSMSVEKRLYFPKEWSYTGNHTGNFALFIIEINTLLKHFNYQLSLLGKSDYDETSGESHAEELFLALICDNKITRLAKHRHKGVIRYRNGLVAIIFENLSPKDDDPLLRDIFKTIISGYEAIKKSIPHNL